MERMKFGLGWSQPIEPKSASADVKTLSWLRPALERSVRRIGILIDPAGMNHRCHNGRGQLKQFQAGVILAGNGSDVPERGLDVVGHGKELVRKIADAHGVHHPDEWVEAGGS